MIVWHGPSATRLNIYESANLHQRFWHMIVHLLIEHINGVIVTTLCLGIYLVCGLVFTHTKHIFFSVTCIRLWTEHHVPHQSSILKLIIIIIKICSAHISTLLGAQGVETEKTWIQTIYSDSKNKIMRYMYNAITNIHHLWKIVT